MAPSPVCITCGLEVGSGPQLNRLSNGQVCPTCRDRLLDSIPSALPSLPMRSGVEMRLEGGYLELLGYLEQLEKAERKLLWGAVQLTVVAHPKARMTLTVYTLGSDKTWLAI